MRLIEKLITTLGLGAIGLMGLVVCPAFLMRFTIVAEVVGALAITMAIGMFVLILYDIWTRN